MKIFDAHVHLAGPRGAYDIEAAGRNLIFNTVAEYRRRRKAAGRHDAVSLIFDHRENLDFVVAEYRAGRADAVKIHPRLQGIVESDYPLLIERLEAVPARLPVVIDTFYYGADLASQPSLRGVISLLKAYPKRRFVLAHCGGRRALDYFLHLRELGNAYYELSFSLQYFEGSSVELDLKKIVAKTDPRRLLYGSDFPFASPRRQLERLEGLARELDLKDADLERILYSNAAALFGRR